LAIWRKEIDRFLWDKLKIILHTDKSRVIPLSKGIDFVGFRNFSHHRLLRKRNIKEMRNKIKLYKKGKIPFEELFESYKGWQAYARWGNSHKLISKIKNEIIKVLWNKI